MEDYDANNSELRKRTCEALPERGQDVRPVLRTGHDPESKRPGSVFRYGASTTHQWRPSLASSWLTTRCVTGRIERDLPFDGYQQHKTEHFTEPRLLCDVRFVLNLVGDTLRRQRWESSTPLVNGKRPWAYTYGRSRYHAPTVVAGFRSLGSLMALRNPNPKKDRKANDSGQSYSILTDTASGNFYSQKCTMARQQVQPTLVKAIRPTRQERCVPLLPANSPARHIEDG